ncbi:PhzF family phenazine biosynthesis protein [Zafaria sp. J156]|uniref:PhzF family phenazine biosynthesis protein n=1 Tax=Zafaria sp. J156 TaxID=3116490 RepID=UPI002E79E0F7|nr:PhzF family phenazine biosynthesis protein [Zafaria sp. J156]MEE1622520.1 PhzF family phenazine biosynthesis protein [Zafaria sp. J156]
MSSRPYLQVDVFTAAKYRGNALAVVLDGTELDPAAMLGFAAWTNLAETTFVLPPTAPGADLRVRIFTTTTELPFAGHPVLGTVHAWLESGGVPARPGEVVIECGAGPVPVRLGQDTDGERVLSFQAPALRRTGPLDPDVLEWAVAGLGLSPHDVLAHQWVANGPNWAGLLLRDAEAVLGLEPDFAALAGLEVGVIGAYGAPGSAAGSYAGTAYDDGARPGRPKGARAELEPLPASPGEAAGGAFQAAVASAPADYEVRAFCPGEGLPEDPVTGSLNAGLAQWLIPNGLAPEHYTVRQGTRLGRTGQVGVARDAEGIWISGRAVTCITGSVELP